MLAIVYVSPSCSTWSLPCLVQFMAGEGLPEALQNSSVLPPSMIVAFAGPLSILVGSKAENN